MVTLHHKSSFGEEPKFSVHSHPSVAPTETAVFVRSLFGHCDCKYSREQQEILMKSDTEDFLHNILQEF